MIRISSGVSFRERLQSGRSHVEQIHRFGKVNHAVGIVRQAKTFPLVVSCGPSRYDVNTYVGADRLDLSEQGRSNYLMIQIGFNQEIRTEPRYVPFLFRQHSPPKALFPLGSGSISDGSDLTGQFHAAVRRHGVIVESAIPIWVGHED